MAVLGNPRSDQANFLRRVRRSVANGAVGASTARHMGAGTVENAQEFFRKLDDVGQFVATSEHEFRQVLDRITDELRCKLPGKQWGAARKFLNIFLRDALYNRFLCEYYKLALIEPFLEVPLDGLVGRWLYKRHRKKGGSDLRPWDAIIRLKPGVSDKYQEFARQVAEEEGCYRVDLDLLGYGRVDEPEDQTRFGRAACLNLPSP